MDCNDNFRSPVELVNDINRFMLTREPVVARSGWQGVPPTYHTHPTGERASIKQIEVCVKALLSEGYMPDQIALVSFSGVKNSFITSCLMPSLNSLNRLGITPDP